MMRNKKKHNIHNTKGSASALPCCFKRLALDRTGWAGCSASAAVDAGICVDLEMLCSFRDSAYWTFASASTTADAAVIDFMCHDHILLY